MTHQLALAMLLLPLAWTQAGCSLFVTRHPFPKAENGCTIILPGIEGAAPWHLSLADGLHEGGVRTSIEIHEWTTGNPALMLIHLRGESRNRAKAAELAAKIIDFQNSHPGEPVNLIGHSGGGGMALLTLEQLPSDHPVNTVVLLAPAVSPDYDLRPVLTKARKGIWNFSSIGDIPLLVAGTTIAGTIDGRHQPAAGAVGFTVPRDATDEEKKLYNIFLHEIKYDLEFIKDGNIGGHFGPTGRTFVRDHIAKLLTEEPSSLLR